MTPKLHIIYIPGLDHTKVGGQRLAVGSWHLQGVSSEVLQMNWADKIETWDAKLARLVNRIDQLHAQGTPVALVGASAGASAAINAFAIRKDMLVGAALIAGKINRPETIESFHNDLHPSFVVSAQASPAALATLDANDRQRIFSYYALNDHILAAQGSEIPDGHNVVLPSVPHPVLIALGLTVYAPRFIRALKQLSGK